MPESVRGADTPDSQSDRARRDTVPRRVARSRRDIPQRYYDEQPRRDAVLQHVLDTARQLSGSRFAALAHVDAMDRVQDPLCSGLTREDLLEGFDLDRSGAFLEHLVQLEEPLRLNDLHAHVRERGLPSIPLLSLIEGDTTFIAAPVHMGRERLGAIFLARSAGAGSYSDQDEQSLLQFANQAAIVLSGARRFRDIQRARTDLEALIDTTPVGVVVFDGATGAPVSINRESRRILSKLHDPTEPIEDAAERIAFRRSDGREILLAEIPLARALLSGETLRGEEVSFHSPDGRSVRALVNSTPIFSDDGELESMVTTLQDLTPIEDLDRLRQEFLGRVGRELNSPLTSIETAVRSLMGTESTLDAADTRQLLHAIDQQVDRMARLVGRLTVAAQIDAGSLPVSPRPRDVIALIGRARNSFVRAGGQHPVYTDLPSALPRVMADEAQILQVLDTLIATAAGLSPSVAAIRIDASFDGLHVAIGVTSDGGRLRAEQLSRLFARFSRVDDSREPETGGTGLTLAICKGLVEAHGGRIWADNDGPEGSARFRFSLPVDHERRSESGLPALEGGEVAVATTEHPRVLLVDDDPQIQQTVRHALGDAAFVTMVAPDPSRVTGLVQHYRPRLILLNAGLPDADVIELIQDLLHQSDAPIILLSAEGLDKIIPRALDAGAADYLVKPFSQTELVARVHTALRRRPGPAGAGPGDILQVGDLRLERARRRVWLADKQLELTISEYELLRELAIEPGRVLTYDYLLRKIWDIEVIDDRRLVHTLVKRLRSKLEDDAYRPSYIVTVPRVGYRMTTAEEARPSSSANATEKHVADSEPGQGGA